MVLQQKSKVNLWGWDTPGAKVRISTDWDGNAIEVKANKKGEWKTSIQTPQAGFDQYSIYISDSEKEIVLSDILFGEVWLCSGQSNMAFTVAQTKDMQGIRANINDLGRNIRIYKSSSHFAAIPQETDAKAIWHSCDQLSVRDFTAVGFAFGLRLQEELGVPVGLIEAAYGGTTIEQWMSQDVIQNDANSSYIQRSLEIQDKLKGKWAHKASQHFNAMINPIIGTTIAGTIWYQGCSNVKYACASYKYELSALINSWRDLFHNQDMPFYVVQIAPHIYENGTGAILRESQAKAVAETAHSALVVTNDCQDIPGDIHPRYKLPVGRRLADCALGEHYGKNIVYKCPEYSYFSKEGEALRVFFRNVPSKLQVRGGSSIRGFQIANENRDGKLEFVLADAILSPDGRSVIVSSTKVNSPIAVRYCFDESVGNLASAEGLPLTPFRSDEADPFRNPSARPYVEQMYNTPIRFNGSGYKKVKFIEGSPLWTDRDYVLVKGAYPEQFEGCEMMICRGSDGKGQKNPGGTITALADGRVYCLARANKTMFDLYDSEGWVLQIAAGVVPGKYKDNGKDGKANYTFASTTYVAYKNVKKGDIVKLPYTDSWYSVMPMAVSIEYVDN